MAGKGEEIVMDRKIFIFIFSQVLILLIMAGSEWAIQTFGDEVKLKTAPVDPRDAFYGDYVTLNYDISDIAVRYFPEGEMPERGDVVYAVLKRDGEYDRLVSAHLKKPTAADDEKILKGRVQYVVRNWRDNGDKDVSIQSVRAIYGLERYYVPEGTGFELENKRGEFDVLVKVSALGQSISELSFNAVERLTRQEAIARVFSYLRERPLTYHLIGTEQAERYEQVERPVWLVDVEGVDKEKKKFEWRTIIVDAKTGEIIDERPSRSSLE